MKKSVLGKALLLTLGIAGTTALAPFLFAQKNFSMDEKRLVERFKRSNALYLDGEKQFIKGNLEKSEKKLQECLEIMPEHANGAYLMAQIQLKREEFSKALESITTAKKNFANIAKFQTFTHQQYLDQLRVQQRDLEVQRERLQDSLSKLPANASSSERSRYEQAVQSIGQAIQTISSRLNSPIPPTFETPADYFYIHGNILFRMGMLIDATTQYQEAIRLDPRHGNAYNNLAAVSFSRGKYQDAMDCLVRAEGAGVKVNPSFKKAVEERLAAK